MSGAHSIDEAANGAAGLWPGPAGPPRPVGHSANHVYSFEAAGETFYLRLVSSEHRTRVQVEAELDFILYLRRGGVGAAAPAPSSAGRLVEELPHGDASLFACVFEEAKGERFRYDPARPDAEHFRLRGRTLGRLHALSKAYAPAAGARRFAWDEDGLLRDVDAFLPGSEEVVRREYEALRGRLQRRPRTRETFGLIHGDFGETNYRHAGGRLNLFDFDDCCYHWFAYDLAVCVYPHGRRPEAPRLLDRLLEGYSEEAPSGVGLADLTTFCQWRLVYMFLVYARKWGFENLTGRQAEWFARRRENIARGYTWGA